MNYRENLIKFLNECRLKEALGVKFFRTITINDKFIKYNGATFTIDNNFTFYTESMLDGRHNQRIQT